MGMTVVSLSVLTGLLYKQVMVVAKACGHDRVRRAMHARTGEAPREQMTCSGIGTRRVEHD
jgi:hypothetical protein